MHFSPSTPSFVTDREVYRGVYGEWEVEDSDVKEVLGYRAGISVAAAGVF